jgi:hypothetical protein
MSRAAQCVPLVILSRSMMCLRRCEALAICFSDLFVYGDFLVNNLGFLPHQLHKTIDALILFEPIVPSRLFWRFFCTGNFESESILRLSRALRTAVALLLDPPPIPVGRAP